MASMKAASLDNLQHKLKFHPPRNLMMISGSGLGIGTASFILVTLMILVTNRFSSSSSSSLFFRFPNSSLVSWSFYLPNTALSSISAKNNATHLGNFTHRTGNGVTQNKTHFANPDLVVKNVSFHSQEGRIVANGEANYSTNLSGHFENGTELAKGFYGDDGGGGFMSRECDIFDGRWVRDDTLPHYPPGSCPYIDTDFNCHLNGRLDTGFYRWNWQPKECKIPRLNATDFLKRLRGQKLVFVGDSLNRNMWESLVCILRHSIKHKKRVYEISGKREFKKEGMYAFRFEDYNCSIDYVRAPFLVKESTFHGKNGSFATLRLDLMDETTKMYRDAHILVFNTGHWWTHEKTSRGEDYYQEGSYVHPRLEALQAYKKALTTWGRWVDRHVNRNKTLVFFRGYSETHFRGGQWNSGGQCHKETEPIFNKTYLGNYPLKMRALEHVLGKMKTHVVYLNISKLTEYRKDAHPSIYRKSYKTAKELSEAEETQDCSHWCLPGVPDIWNELLYASLLKVGWGSPIPRQ